MTGRYLLFFQTTADKGIDDDFFGTRLPLADKPKILLTTPTDNEGLFAVAVSTKGRWFTISVENVVLHSTVILIVCSHPECIAHRCYYLHTNYVNQ